jgi:hypothetical protein
LSCVKVPLTIHLRQGCDVVVGGAAKRNECRNSGAADRGDALDPAHSAHDLHAPGPQHPQWSTVSLSHLSLSLSLSLSLCVCVCVCVSPPLFVCVCAGVCVCVRARARRMLALTVNPQ